jgi:hypothetical protein
MIGMVHGNEIRVLDRRRLIRDSADGVVSLDDKTPLTTALKRREPVWLESTERFRAL